MASIFEAIHARWAADTALMALVPAASFITGNVEVDSVDEPARPYVSLQATIGGAPEYTNLAKHADRSVRFLVFEDADDFDNLLSIVAALEAAFDRAAFTVDDDQTALNMQETGAPQYLQDDAGRWYAVVDFRITLRKTL